MRASSVFPKQSPSFPRVKFCETHQNKPVKRNTMSHIVTAKSLPAKCLNQISQATLELLVVRLENENDAYLLCAGCM